MRTRTSRTTRRSRPRRRQRRGTAMLLLVVLLVLGAVMVSSAAVGGAREDHLSAERLATLRAFYAAEAGMNLAMREVLLQMDEDGDGAIGGISDDGDDANNPLLGAAAIVVERRDEGGEVQLASRGDADQAQRFINASLIASTGGDGLFARYFALDFRPSRLNQIDWEGEASHEDTVAILDWPRTRDRGNPLWPGGPDTNYGAEFTGYVTVDSAGAWTFYTRSDDGSKLWINDELVVNNDGLHSMRERSGSISLDAGRHEFRVQFFERRGNHGLIVSWRGPGLSKEVIPPDAYAH